MSEQLSFLDHGLAGVRNDVVLQSKRASLYREIGYLLAISTKASAGSGYSLAGLAHSFGVCMIEVEIMARGGKGGAEGQVANGLPRFVDVKLTTEDREGFVVWREGVGDIIPHLQRLVDSGIRVGCAWSTEHQSYTVSLTCRDQDSPNNGLCMTSFAGSLVVAVALAVYKHEVVTDGVWFDSGKEGGEVFG